MKKLRLCPKCKKNKVRYLEVCRDCAIKERTPFRTPKIARRVIKLLEALGYEKFRLAWFRDGLWTFCKQKPTHQTPMPWVPVWQSRKIQGNYIYHLEVKLDSEFASPYAVIELHAYRNGGDQQHPHLHNRAGLRGPSPSLEIREILEEDIVNLPLFESYLADCLEQAVKVKFKISTNKS